MMRFARLLIAGLLVMSGVAFAGEKDGPYILVYREHFDYSVTTGTLTLAQCVGAGCNYQSERRDPIGVEYYPTLEKALNRLNERDDRMFRDDNGAAPKIRKDDLILLVKGKRIDLDVQDSGRKTTVSHNVWKTEDVPVQEWDVKQ